jgi:cell division protein FtsL
MHAGNTIREKHLAMKRVFLSNTFRVALAVFVLTFGVLYVVCTSSISTKGYDITDMEKQITNLKRENQKLEFKIAQHRSMQSIQERLEGMDLVSADNIQYKTIIDTTVARR